MPREELQRVFVELYEFRNWFEQVAFGTNQEYGLKLCDALQVATKEIERLEKDNKLLAVRENNWSRIIQKDNQRLQAEVEQLKSRIRWRWQGVKPMEKGDKRKLLRDFVLRTSHPAVILSAGTIVEIQQIDLLNGKVLIENEWVHTITFIHCSSPVVEDEAKPMILDNN